jgi:hypothetical protein
MNKKNLEHYKQMAFDEGINDTLVDELLDENARLFIDSEVKYNMTDEQREEIHQEYRAGFIRGFGVQYLKQIIKNHK